ncbi:MAG: HflK protein [Deltaproteobacteria bacterium RIFOXYA12_FULL_58_15]|nr:MAG: HflK protein [Deltaproteobacteria bacterium RIFOXYA12_FULL_58_15]
MSSFDPFSDAKKQAGDAQKFARENKKPLIGLLVAVVAVGGLWSSYYQVEPDELGVVMRFGKHIGNTEPGPHFKIPFGIDAVAKVPVGRQLQEEFGFRTTRSDIRSEFARDNRTLDEAIMLTGDRNVANVEWVVQYKIRNPEKYLFNFRHVEKTLRLMAEATMRSVVGDHSIDEILTTGRAEVEQIARAQLVKMSELYDTGLAIELINLKNVNVPPKVQPALREVEAAKQERDRMVNEAETEYNKIIPRADGRAKQSVESASGYAIERVKRAEGDANRFRALVTEYRKAPAVTRTRLYIEGMSKILPKAKRKVIVDAKTQGLVPLLNMSGVQP